MANLAQLLVAALSIAVCAPVVHAAEPAPQYPSHTLRSGQISLQVYLPDPDRGFYRSTRFDWSGMVARVDYKGHKFFAPWKSPHNPLDTEDVIGTAEEFGMQKPLGYEEAKAGETFIKIGVGHLVKGKNESYGFAKDYRISKPAAWQIEKDDRSIQFHQTLTDERGFGYDYTKRISIPGNEAGFVIDRVLKNTGSRPIPTNHYCHNFTMIDDEMIGPAYSILFAFAPAVSLKEQARLQDLGQIQGNQMLFARPIAPDKPLWCLLEGYKNVDDHVITIRNNKTGAAVKIVGDYPMSRLAFYGATTAACPEPFTEFTLLPGQQKTWQTRYVFLSEKDR